MPQPTVLDTLMQAFPGFTWVFVEVDNALHGQTEGLPGVPLCCIDVRISPRDDILVGVSVFGHPQYLGVAKSWGDVPQRIREGLRLLASLFLRLAQDPEQTDETADLKQQIATLQHSLAQASSFLGAALEGRLVKKPVDPEDCN